jgi:hypothetical protein
MALLVLIALLAMSGWKYYKSAEEIEAARAFLIAKPYRSRSDVWNVDGIVMSTDEMLGCYRVQRAIQADPRLTDDEIISRLNPPRQVMINFAGRCFYRKGRGE